MEYETAGSLNFWNTTDSASYTRSKNDGHKTMDRVQRVIFFNEASFFSNRLVNLRR